MSITQKKTELQAEAIRAGVTIKDRDLWESYTDSFNEALAENRGSQFVFFALLVIIIVLVIVLA